MTEQPDSEDRFGVADSTIIEVIKEHCGVVRAGCYVPTRSEVATKDAAWLTEVLIDWWWESPTALIPTWGQVKEVLAILRSREDADTAGIQTLIGEAPSEQDLGDGS